MLSIFLILIFIRPFISSLAFPYVNFVYSVALLILLVTYTIYKKLLFQKNKILIYPFILFSLSLVISMIFSQNKLNSFSEVYKYITGILLFFIAASLSGEDKILTMRIITLAGLAISFLAIYQYFFGFKHVSDYLLNNKLSSPFVLDYLSRKRVFLPFVTPGILGGYLAMIIPLALINKNRAWFILPIFFALLLTKSLGALLSLFCALIIYFCLRGKLKKTKVFFLLGLLISAVIIFILRSLAQKEHTQPIFSMLMRLNYWKGAWEVIKAHPLVGVGLGNFNLKMSRYAHNAYLQIWAEMGILGLVSFIWIIYAVFKSCYKNLTEFLYKNQITALVAASSVFLIHNFFDFSFFLPEVVYIWWVILGLIVAIGTKKNAQN